MALKTLSALVTDVQRALYQGAGPSVQTYSQDIIASMVQNAFDHIFGGAGKDLWWPQYIVRELKTLDGVTGRIIGNFERIKQFDDVRYVIPEFNRKPLPTLPISADIFRLQSGTSARYIDPVTDSKLFQAWPKTATDNIVVVGRQRPNPFALNQIVPFDDSAIVHFAAWAYFTDDGSNPVSADKHQGLFESRLSDLERAAFGNLVQLTSPESYIPDRWEEW